MRWNKKVYKIFVLIIFYESSLFSSQQSNVSVDILKSIVSLRFCKSEKYRLSSSRDLGQALTRQLVIYVNHNEKTTKSFDCFRLDGETLLLLSAKKDRETVVIASCYGKGDSVKQLNDLNSVFRDLKNEAQNVKLIVLNCQNDAGVSFEDKPFWEQYKKQLRTCIGIEPKMIAYGMVPGKDHQDRNHFECRIDDQGVSWKSAIDNYQHHSL